MFVYLRHGDNEQFLVNTNCPVILLLEHIKAKLELSKTDLVDLCDEGGALKLLFLSRRLEDCARPQLPPRCSFTVCSVNRRAMDGAYVSISPLLANPDPALLETLQTQTDSLEKARLIQLRSQEVDRFQKTVKSKRRDRAVRLNAAEVKPLPQTGRRNRRN
ncbi:uncharacterized protein CXorf65 homolog [Anguilla anguilla]|uniref:uncharacterized protein CXorf65 homolog n=1 Tax=Anguilla anguilla TaxID=7936 RepID=UPI0015AE0509|nr:uncharacterized protein CXorf65 homolog [Anguilla anguilla]